MVRKIKSRKTAEDRRAQAEELQCLITNHKPATLATPVHCRPFKPG